MNSNISVYTIQQAEEKKKKRAAELAITQGTPSKNDEKEKRAVN
jgi:hypothetical protein